MKKVLALTFVSLLAFGCTVKTTDNSGSSSSSDGSSEYASLFEVDGTATKDDEYGTWAGATQTESGVEFEARLKLETDRATIAAKCTYEDTVVYAGATSSGTIKDGTLTLTESASDSQPVATINGVAVVCKAAFSKGTGTYKVKGTTLTVLGIEWSKVADLE